MAPHFPSRPLINVLKSCKTLTCFQQIHVHIIKRGLQNHIYLISNFISLFFDKFNISNNNNDLFDYPTSVFNSVVYRHDVLCNAFLKGCFAYSSLSNSLSVLSGFRVSGFCPGTFTFPLLINRCSMELSGCVGFGVHGLLIKYGFEDDLYVGSSLVDFYGKCGLLGDAQKVFDEMPVRSVVSWTSLVEACVNYGDLVSARRVFDEMPSRNHVSWNVMISGYVNKGEFDEVKRLLDEMACKYVADGYAKRGVLTCARALFNQCQEKDCSLWLTLISGYVQIGQPVEAVKCFREMLRNNTRPDEFIMVKVMSACAQLENLHLARELDSFVMNCSSFDHRRPHVVAALVDMNAKCGNMERAMYLFKNTMPYRDLTSYCSMIQGCSIRGQGTNAVELFYDMISEGIVPDSVAFAVILTACCRSRLVEEGCRLFDMMKNYYLIVPSTDHYSCMVDLLRSSGH